MLGRRVSPHVNVDVVRTCITDHSPDQILLFRVSCGVPSDPKEASSLTVLAYRFIWVARGLSLSGRVRYLEERWAYFFAFGLPLAVLCTWGSGLANAALFALLFPAVRVVRRPRGAW